MGSLCAAVVSCFVVSVSPGEAQKPVEDLFLKMRKAYQAIDTASLQARLRFYAPSATQTGIMSVDYARPFKIRYTAEVGQNRVQRYSDGKQVVTIRDGNRTETAKINVDTVGGQVPGNLEWLCFFDWKRQLSTTPGNNMAKSTFKLIPVQKWNGKNWIVLEETAPEVNVGVRYFIDPRTYLIWRCDVKSLSTKKETVRTEVTKLVLHPKLNPAIFSPPPII